MTSQKKHTVMAVVLMLGYVDLLTYFVGEKVMYCCVWVKVSASTAVLHEV